MTRSTGTFSRYAFALLHRVLPGLERRRLKRERTQLLRLAVEQDRLHWEQLPPGQQCVLTLLRGGWELRHMDGVGETVDGWYVVNVATCESIDISIYTGNALRRKGLITKIHTEESVPVTTWKEAIP